MIGLASTMAATKNQALYGGPFVSKTNRLYFTRALFEMRQSTSEPLKKHSIMKLKDERAKRGTAQNHGLRKMYHRSDNRQFKENTNFSLFNCGMELIFFTWLPVWFALVIM